jgi:NAD(P) transhydrogenase subunit alpha
MLVESGAGAAASFPDADFVEAGAESVDRATALAADIVVKVRKPAREEIAALSDGAILIGLLEQCEDDGTLQALQDKGVRMLVMERIPRISRAQSMDALSSQSNIAGYRAVLEAANRYRRFFPLMMTSAGSAKPARVVVLGAGVAGLQAIATARRMGAEVWAYDVRPETKEQIESLGAKVIVLDLGESGAGEGGYAKELSAEAKARQQQLLADELAKAHVIVTTALIPCRPAPVLITEEVVQRMREGSVIVDLAAATGGNCPLTEKDRVVVKHGVTLVGYTNFPALVPADASAFYGGNIKNLLDIMVDKGEQGLLLKDLAEDEITKAMLARPGS